jgi:Mg2+ and Co2+ transporter CorA
METCYDDMTFPAYGTAVQEFIFWTLNQARSNPNIPPPSPDLLPVAFFTMICSQWMLMCEYVNTRLGQIEYEIELGLSNLYAQDFDHTLKSLLLWRRRMPIYHTFVERCISRLSVRFKPKTDTSHFDSWEDILTNLKDILHRLEILHCRADKIMTVSMAVTSREESKKATQESHAITRVSYLAFIFVPLSFLASFFSMSDDFLVRTSWIYASVAVPLSVCALLVLIYAGRIGRGLKRVKEAGLRLKEGRKGVKGGV